MDAAPTVSRRSRLSPSGLLEVATLLLWMATAAGFLGRTWWIFELTSHFRPHLAVCLLGLGVIWTWKRRWPLALGSGTFAVINAAVVSSLLLPLAQPAPAGGKEVRLASINVHTANQRGDLVRDFLHGAEADFILLLEVNERWMNDLSGLRVSHQHLLADPREDNFGIALFSRVPLTDASVIELGEAGVPSVTAEVQVGDTKLTLLGTHPLPPGTAAYARLRNGQLRDIAAWTRAQTNPVVVLGDLNITPWSPYFRDLLREGGLKSASQGRGLRGSWPTWLPVGRILLDHCLVSPSIRVVNRQFGPHVGADHLPIVVDLRLRADE
jgi:endonuclease/exonuclease/phosphatase (EEP) superfamily protein YafD